MARSNVVRLSTVQRNRSEDREEKMARIIFHCIERELPDAEFFTREDLLQLKPLQSVATITRYHELCMAVQRLIASRRLVAVSRTELALAGHVAAGRASAHELRTAYTDTLDRILARFKRTKGSKSFSVMDVVLEWVTDPHLTINAKRVAVRTRLRALATAGKLGHGELLDYYFED